MKISMGGSLRGAAVAVLALGLSACAAADLGLNGLADSRTEFDPFRDDAARAPLTLDDLPVDAEAAVAAAVMRLRGRSAGEVKKVLSVGGGERVRSEESFDYQGFAVTEIELIDFDIDDERPAVREIAGYLHFADGYNRRAAVGFEIAYRLAGESPLAITSARLAPAYPRGAKAVMYVAPAAALRAGLSKAETYGDFYRALRASATPMRLPATAAPAPGRADRVIVVLFEDRLPNGDTIEAGISDRRDGLESYTGATRYLVFEEGWVAAMIPGRFALGAGEAFWVKAIHTPAAGADGKAEPALVGLFSTNPAAAPAN